LKAQTANNFRSKLLSIKSDTTTLDTLSIIAGSVTISDLNGTIVSTSTYTIEYGKSQIISKNIRGDFKIQYRVFSVLFSNPYFHKSYFKYINSGPDSLKRVFFSEPGLSSNDLYGGSLETNGSISRGISVGNNQDIIMNSNLNLQLSGYLTESIKLEGSISDNNIPIQPDGNSQQIQDFDKVFIRIYNKQNQAVLGDYEINNRYGSLLKYHKKGQGIMAETITKTDKYTETSQASIAISKGKTCRKLFQGKEGNQGPYKITGCDNELYIVVLSGTEKVFVDGQLKKRGEDADYIIDYNTGEIRFTPYFTITKDSRIAVDFEYSDKNYARFMVASNNSFETSKSKSWINILTENDNKNQPLQQNLNDARKDSLAKAGDNLAVAESAILDSSKSISKTFYNKKDTITNGITYNGVYVRSTNNNSIQYSVTFSFVGTNNGDYILDQSNANGKAYKWIAPDGNNHFGNYLPVIILIAPKKKQVIALGNEMKISKNTSSYIEMAVSNNDANTFSNKDDKNNNGIGLKFGITHKLTLDSNKHSIDIQFNQSYYDKTFSPFDAYKSVEFDRDWNMKSVKAGNEFLSKASLKGNLSIGELAYDFEYLNRIGVATGNRHSVYGTIAKQSYLITYNGSITQSSDSSHNSNFDKYSISTTKKIKQITVGISTQQEYNSFKNKNDNLSLASSRFISHKAFVSKTDSSKWTCNISAEYRQDYHPDTISNAFKNISNSYDYKTMFGVLRNPKNKLKVIFNYRLVSPIEKEYSKKENNVSARLEHQLVLFKKLIMANTFYQLSSGVEAKKAYSFVEVTPGLGVYMWNTETDYNKNGKADINEFEIAKFKYQANYIKVSIPTEQTINTISNQCSEVLIIDPHFISSKNNKTTRFLSRFYNISNYKCLFKTIDNNYLNNSNPFRSTKNDTMLTSIVSNISNTVYFNRTSSKFSCNYTISRENNKTLTTNGWESFNQLKHTITNRTVLYTSFSIYTKFEKGLKTSKNEAGFMDNKNYHIDFKNLEPKITWQPNPYYAIDIISGINDLNNDSKEHALKESLGLEMRISGEVSPWKLTVNGKYIKIKYNAETNTSLAYTMLDGLLPGNNVTWEVNFQNNLGKNLRLNLLYQGQKSESSKVLHTGNIQLSAFF